jgi:hypothetical protein
MAKTTAATAAKSTVCSRYTRELVIPHLPLQRLSRKEREIREANLNQIVAAVLDYQNRGITEPEDLVQALLPEYEGLMTSGLSEGAL